MKTLSLILLILSTTLMAQPKHALTFDDLWAMKRIGKVQLSPDGNTIAFNVTTYSFDENKGNIDIYLVDVDGKNIHPFKNSVKNETNPKFSPDGKKIAYVFDSRIWTANLDGSDEQKLTNLSTGASGIVYSNDGKKMLFVSSVYPDCTTDDCNKEKDKQKEESKVKASIFTELMYRHWDEWRGEKRSHLFLLDISSKEVVDLTLNSKSDVPPIALGSDNDYSFSPDGSEIVFTMNPDNVVATSTNNEIFILKLADIQKEKPTPFKKISESKGNDCQPVYSPDGNFIAYTSMERAGFEADKSRLMLYNRKTGTTNILTKDNDLSVSEFVWSPDAKSIYFLAENEIYNSIYKLEVATSKLTLLQKEGDNANLLLSNDGQKLFFKQQRTNLPYEIFSISTEGKDLKQITFTNSDRLASIEMNPLETFWCKGANGTKVQSILVKPPFFDVKKKYPMIFLVHGGPQGHWSDDFHYRWNLHMFASKGYVVVATNPRGSTGYGQKFVDEISGDWGGKPYVDLMNAYDYAVKNFSFIDAKNTFAAGASYGGYMINWIAGHTNRFNALVSHDGMYNAESAWGTTEELWFNEWEFKGAPFQNRKLYEKFSPSRFIQNCKTPMLIIHSANDFRLSEEQAFQLFTALQRLDVESKFLYFPDESHWVTKPQNAKLWWDTVLDWFETHKK
ncbi:MAG: S9 family peptidase [Ignavibacteria bacterium CG_4_8_14_3_um_filter_37_9]|nr:S9 family peptidase [Ignavibacteria bacterium]OIO24009.1 MAG: dipeptidyl aminopeptidase [Ignavibacteria bacterium CG1_02_37_35]PIW98787.1 MAG: S9 family peptidase [Ignavibacteria bacterium CG_4_8_14_3_um_filter_37_9]